MPRKRKTTWGKLSVKKFDEESEKLLKEFARKRNMKIVERYHTGYWEGTEFKISYQRAVLVNVYFPCQMIRVYFWEPACMCCDHGKPKWKQS